MTHISVIIPHRGNTLGLWATAHSIFGELSNSRHVKSYELVIVSNGGKLSGEDRISIGELKRLGNVKHVHRGEALTPPVARSLGVAESEGEHLFFFDNHCVVHPTYFDRSVLNFEQRDIDMLHSTTVFHEGDGKHYHYNTRLDYNFWGESRKHPQDELRPYMIGLGGHGGFAVKRSVWDAVGGYGPDNLLVGYGGEEPIFDLKLWRMGYKVWIDARVIHYHYPGHRGYPRHYTDEYYANCLVAAHVIGGEKWLYKVFDSFTTKQHVRLRPKMEWYDILKTAYHRSAEYAHEVDAMSVKTLDEVLEWFRLNGVAH